MSSASALRFHATGSVAARNFSPVKCTVVQKPRPASWRRVHVIDYHVLILADDGVVNYDFGRVALPF